MAYMPIVSNGREREDILSRLLKDRIILLTGQFNEELSTSICAQLLYLESVDSKKDISLYINSPGGYVTDYYAIMDTMHMVQCDVSTIVMGNAASCGAMTLIEGAKGKRFALPNAMIMFHEPSGGFRGPTSDAERHFEQLRKHREKFIQRTTELTGLPLEEVKKKFFDRDNFFTAQEALDLGVIDGIITKHAIKTEDQE